MLIPHDKQEEIITSRARFKVIRAGRKAGKTAGEIELICYKATEQASKLNLTKTRFPTGRKVVYIAPTQKQARSIIWAALKKRLHNIGTPNEQQLEMRVPNKDGEESTIYVGGWENRENYRGFSDVIHITFDETDTLRDFYTNWLEIFRPMFLDTGGSANFIGTPKKENPNLRRLEKEFESRGREFASFKFTSLDNPHLAVAELEALKNEYSGDLTAYQQEILAEYVENEGALFKYTALLDMFTNTVDMDESYLTVDIADDGSDKTIFTRWKGLCAMNIDRYAQLQTDGIINQIREDAQTHRIPYSHIAVDAIGVGAGVASSPLLTGIIGFKSSYSAMRTDVDPVRIPNVHYRTDAPLTTEYKNLRSQCVFELSRAINDHKLAVRVSDERVKSNIIEELSSYQDASTGDGKRMATMKEDIKEAIGRSPDLSDTLIMRMFFELRGKLSPAQDPQKGVIQEKILAQFRRNEQLSRSNK